MWKWLLKAMCVVSLMGCPAPKKSSSSSSNPPAACANRAEGDLVITEFMANPDGTDTGKEYIEIFNATNGEIDLQDLSLSIGKVDEEKPLSHSIKSLKVAAKGYVTLGDSRDDVVGPKVSYSYGNSIGNMNNEAGLIAIKCGNKTIDQVIYTSSTSGKARIFSGQFDATSAANDSEVNWCDAKQKFDEVSYGSPATVNEPCSSAGFCVDSGGKSRATVAPKVGDLIVTEFLANPVGTETEREWVEFAVNASVDLNGVEFQSGATKFTFTSTECLRVAADSFVVLTRKNDPNFEGAWPEVFDEMTNNLSNTASTLTLSFNGEVLDSVSYASTKEGFSTQLDRDAFDVLKNDDPTQFCLATLPYGDGLNHGTPGAINDECPPVVGADQCLDTASGQPRDIRRAQAGDLVISEFLANPAGTDTGKEWFEVHVKNEVDLNDLELANEGTGKTLVKSTTCLSATAGSYVVFAANVDSAVNGNLPVTPVGSFNFTLANSGARAISVRWDGGVIDTVTYGAGVDGGPSLNPVEARSTQLDLASLDHLQNDDVTRFCASPVAGASYGAPDAGGLNYGTPGAANVSCAP